MSSARWISGCVGEDEWAGAIRGRGDRDATARLLLERHPQLVGWELERLGEVVSDLDRERLAEVTLVPIVVQVQLERLRLDAARFRPVLDGGDIQVGLACERADGSELVARQLDARRRGVVVPSRHASSSGDRRARRCAALPTRSNRTAPYPRLHQSGSAHGRRLRRVSYRCLHPSSMIA